MSYVDVMTMIVAWLAFFLGVGNSVLILLHEFVRLRIFVTLMRYDPPGAKRLQEQIQIHVHMSGYVPDMIMEIGMVDKAGNLIAMDSQNIREFEPGFQMRQGEGKTFYVHSHTDFFRHLKERGKAYVKTSSGRCFYASLGETRTRTIA